jgi:Glycosyltransferase family 92
MNYLAACCVFKDELRYLREWIEYHRAVGVERFYMVSNDDSPDAARRLLAPYIERGEVVFTSRPGGPFAKLQPGIFLDVIEAAVGHVRWLAFLDTDEFLVPVQAASVPEALSVFDDCAALAVNWACFGSSGLKRPPELQTEAFRRRLPDHHEDNRIFKSIVNPAKVVASYNPHRFILAEPEVLVDEFRSPVIHAWRNDNDPFFGSRLRINHYRIRSEMEFSEKLARWHDGAHPELGNAEQAREFWRRCDEGDVIDETIQRFVPEVKRRLAGPRGFGAILTWLARAVGR